MSFLKDIVGAAAPVVGSFLGGPLGGAVGSAIGGLVAGGGSGQVDATRQATAEQMAAIREAQNRITSGAETAQGFLTPFAGVGQRGIDLSTFLADPAQQASFLESNPLFQLGLDNANMQTNKSAAARGRLTAGDTLEQLNRNAMLVGQPLIDRQRQDILNLLSVGQTTAGQQVGVEQNTARALADLLTGGGATQAAGTIAGANAESARKGNIFDIGMQLAGNQDVQDFVGGLFNSPSSSTGSFANAPIGPLQ
ncbi:MAG: hypothetical protein ACPGUE_12090 [Marinomonas sp.]